jgi:2-polyprenyl-3-methyl-5-hydroxy-6-metoxy-1,4-benzoquinol methylase
MKTASGAEWHQWESVACAICGQDNSDLLFETHDWIYGNEGVFRVVKCRNCRLAYMNPRPAPEEAWKFYPQSYHAYQPRDPIPENLPTKPNLRHLTKLCVLEQSLGYPSAAPREPSYPRLLQNGLVRRLLARLLKSRVESAVVPPFLPRRRLLDVGCGSGDYLLAMRQLGWDTHGLELNPSAARYAREQLDLPVLEGRLPEPRLDTGSFDVITMRDSFEHMPNPCEVLKDIRRLLTPGGLLILNTPNFDSIYRRVFGDRWFNVAAPLHYYHYTRETMPRLLSKNGFRLTRVLYPLGAAGMKQTLQILLTGKVGERGAFRNPLVRMTAEWLHRLSPRGHLLVHAVRQ